jgi:hypothetical protein
MVQMASNKIDRHPTGVKIFVKDGHLVVQSYDADIAIYAPGVWKRAKHGSGESWSSATDA